MSTGLKQTPESAELRAALEALRKAQQVLEQKLEQDRVRTEDCEQTRARLEQAQNEIRRLDEYGGRQSRRLDLALIQLHRRCPCETCAHGDGKGGCLIGGCTYTRADNLDLWEWNGWRDKP